MTATPALRAAALALALAAMPALAQDAEGWRRDRATQAAALIDYIDRDRAGFGQPGTMEEYGYETLDDRYRAKNNYIDTVSELIDLFKPFTHDCNIRFRSDNVTALHRRLAPHDREALLWDPQRDGWPTAASAPIARSERSTLRMSVRRPAHPGAGPAPPGQFRRSAWLPAPGWPLAHRQRPARPTGT